MSYSRQHKEAMAFIYQNLKHIEGLHYEVDDLMDFILHRFAEGDPERALQAFEKGKEVYGTQVWKDALDRAKKELFDPRGSCGRKGKVLCYYSLLSGGWKYRNKHYRPRYSPDGSSCR